MCTHSHMWGKGRKRISELGLYSEKRLLLLLGRCYILYLRKSYVFYFMSCIFFPKKWLQIVRVVVCCDALCPPLVFLEQQENLLIKNILRNLGIVRREK